MRCEMWVDIATAVKPMILRMSCKRKGEAFESQMVDWWRPNEVDDELVVGA